MAKNIIEEVDISTVKENPKNPRTISKSQFELLKKSITEFPEMLNLRPLVIDGNNVVLGGNMRLKALIALGYKKVPVLRADKLTAKQKKEFTIKDNANYGIWDMDVLANEWSDLPLLDWGIELPADWMQPEVSEDDFEIPDKIKTTIKLGDIFQIGNHRLMCGDSSKKNEVDKLMNGQKADMVWTDPPYGVAIGAKNRMLNSFQKAGRNLTDIVDDSASPDELYKILLPCFINLRESCTESASYYVTSPQGGGIGMMMMMMMKAGLEVRHVLIWLKNSPTFSMGRLNYDYKHEPIFFTWTKKHNFYGGGKQKTSIWQVDKPRANKEHPTMKPLALMENAMLNSSKENDLVIDFFLGSGSTMVAAEQLKRKCYGMEISPEYCQVIIDRMKKAFPEIEINKVK